MNKKLWLSGVLVLLLAVSAGCGQKPEAVQSPPQETGVHGAGNTDQNQGGNKEENTEGDAEGVPADQEQVEKLEIQTYFTDDQVDQLIAVKTEIAYSGEEQKYEQALSSLQKSNDAGLLSLWEKATFNDIKMNDGNLTVDITLPDEARLGSGGEALAVEALTKQLFQFEEIQTIDILVDGEQADTLMGHVELEHPIQRK